MGQIPAPRCASFAETAFVRGDAAVARDVTEQDLFVLDHSRTQALSHAQLGQLAAQITAAIKTNMPNAIVAMDHSLWNSDDVTRLVLGRDEAGESGPRLGDRCGQRKRVHGQRHHVRQLQRQDLHLRLRSGLKAHPIVRS